MAEILFHAVRDEHNVAATRHREQKCVEELHETLGGLGVDQVAVGLFRAEYCKEKSSIKLRSKLSLLRWKSFWNFPITSKETLTSCP